MTNLYKPAGKPDLFLCLIVKNPTQSHKFYQNAFGFKLMSTPLEDEQNNIIYAEMRRGDAIITFCSEDTYPGCDNRNTPKETNISPSATFYIYCEDVDTLYNIAIQNGAKSIKAPEDAPWGDKYCVLLDLDGYEFIFATHK